MAPGDLERRIERIEELIQRLERDADPVLRGTAQELVRSLMDLHGAALERIVAMAGEPGGAAPGGNGPALLDRFTGDELVRSVLLLYGLHPVGVELRVREALEKTRPYLRSHGGNVELVSVDEGGTVRLRMEGSCHGCPSSAVTLKLAIEQAIREAAPDVTAILVEGDGAAPAGVPPGPERQDAGLWESIAELGRVPEGGHRLLTVRGRAVLFCRLDDTFYAYGPRCPACGADLAEADLTGGVLACAVCRHSYDVVKAGRGLDRADLHLDPFPLLVEDGRARVALPANGTAPEPD